MVEMNVDDEADMLDNRFRVLDPVDNTSIFTYYSEFEPTFEGQTELEITVLVVLFVIAILSNVSVLMVAYRRRKHIKVTDIFITNISLSDILLTTAIPLLVTARLSPQWLLGAIGCKTLLFIQCLGGCTSIFSSVVISIDRYIRICRTRFTGWWVKKITNKLCLGLVLGIWSMACCVSIPVFIGTNERRILFGQRWYVFCYISWTNKSVDLVVISIYICVLFITPLVVSAIAYLSIWWFVRKSSRKITNTRVRNNSTRTVEQATINRPELKLIKMFASILLAFFVTLLPFFVVSFMIVYTKLMTSSNFFAAVVITQITACVDPVIYGYFNDVYRQGMKSALSCRRRNVIGVSLSPETGTFWRTG